MNNPPSHVSQNGRYSFTLFIPATVFFAFRGQNDFSWSEINEVDRPRAGAADKRSMFSASNQILLACVSASDSICMPLRTC